jgi:hypothetical protein
MGEDAHTGLTGEFGLGCPFLTLVGGARYGPSSHIDQREAEALLQALQTIKEAKCAPRPLSHRLGVTKEMSR